MTLTPADFHAAMQRTVTSFVPDGPLYRNTKTGRIMTAGTITFDCGHSYMWHPYIADDEPLPSAGKVAGCATCIEALLPKK